MSGQLDALTIEEGLQERYEQQRHNIVYVTVFDTGSVLGCTRCGWMVQVTVNELGGWRLTNNILDTLCAA